MNYKENYFSALWKTAFDAKNTFDSEFNTTRGVVTTPFMTLDLKVKNSFVHS